jgi:hypothetical protein
MPLGIFVGISGASSKIIQYQTRALPKRNYYVHIHIAVTNLPKRKTAHACLKITQRAIFDECECPLFPIAIISLGWP